jgi:hypothetical protein
VAADQDQVVAFAPNHGDGKMPGSSNKINPYLLLGALLLFACQPVEKRHEVPTADDDEDANTVPVTITATEPMAGSDPNSETWLVSCGPDKFLVNLITPAQQGERFAFTTGRFCRYQKADARQCLESIARALEAKKIETPRERSECLPFQAAILGQDLNHNLSSDPPGTWLAAKLFVADGEGELYFNLSPKTGEAEISIKDSEYGDIVVRELAKVLASPAR